MRCGVGPRTSSVNMAMRSSRLMASADKFLRESPPQPIYINDLCRALGVSYRRLYEAFMLTRGESPSLHLKRQRLMMAHQVLSNAGSEAPLVKTVALDHGFWHFSNFSQDYRKLFGETPSETLALARSRENKLPRDDQKRIESAASGSVASLRRRRGQVQTRHGETAASSLGEVSSVLQWPSATPSGYISASSSASASSRRGWQRVASAIGRTHGT
jgi:AraC-like DNA-binding protein